MDAKELIKKQHRHAVFMLVIWVLIVIDKFCEYIPTGLKTMGVHNWIMIFLGIVVIIYEIINLHKLKMQKKQLSDEEKN